MAESAEPVPPSCELPPSSATAVSGVLNYNRSVPEESNLQKVIRLQTIEAFEIPVHQTVLCDSVSYGRTRRERSRSATSRLPLCTDLFQLHGWDHSEQSLLVRMRGGTLLDAVRVKVPTLPGVSQHRG